MIPKASNVGLVMLVLAFLEEGSPISFVSTFGAVAIGTVRSTPQLERSPPDRTNKAAITAIQV
jgi:hypothetical protein